MRRGMKPNIVFENEKVIGVNLSSDFTAEHEWGIAKINDAFGIDVKAAPGVSRRKINTVPNTLTWIDDRKSSGFVYRPWWVEKTLEQITKRVVNHEELHELAYTPNPLRAAWSEDDFAVISSGPEQKKALREVYHAFESFDIGIFLAGKQLFENAGLCITILSRLPQSIKDLWKSADEEADKLRKAFADSGIAELLTKKGKRWYALTPRKFDKDGELLMWLNPQEQNKYNAGWVTLQDLLDWSNDKGKVMKEKK